MKLRRENEKRINKKDCHSSIIWYNNVDGKNYEIPIPPSLDEFVGAEHPARLSIAKLLGLFIGIRRERG